MNITALVRARGFEHFRKKQGWFGYPVDGLNVSVKAVEPQQVVDAGKLRGGFVVIEDWAWPELINRRKPVALIIVDSNTSPKRRGRYLAYAQRVADILLVDQDELGAFRVLGKPAYRFAYATNERVFYPTEGKPVDVAYHCASTVHAPVLHREALEHWVRENIAPKYRTTIGARIPLLEYIQRICDAKIVIHTPTHKQCRTHRVFDALAAGCCLLTAPLPSIDGDGFIPGKHYLVWHNYAELQMLIDDMMRGDAWRAVAEAGRAFVLEHHTWATRARRLIEILEKHK